MKNFTLLLFISFLFFSCSKHNEWADNITPGPAVPPPAPPAVTKVTVIIDDTLMHITSLTYERHGTGAGGGISITATNDAQKVTVVVAPFYQYNPPWSMMYPMEVSYFARGDNGNWAIYPRPIPRDDEVRFDNYAILSDKIVNGSFSGTFIGGDTSAYNGGRTVVRGDFSLVF